MVKNGNEHPSIRWPADAWLGFLANHAWTANLQNGSGQSWLKTQRLEQEQLFRDGQEMFDRWCERRRNTVALTWTLLEELQQAGGGRGSLSAWLKWQQTALQELTEDTRDQFEFASKAAMRCTGILSEGRAISPDNGRHEGPGGTPGQNP